MTDLTQRIQRAVRSMLGDDPERAERDYEHLLVRAGDLVSRKLSMQGTKSETRDLVGEIVFSRLRRSFRSFLDTPDAEAEIKVAEWTLATVIGAVTMLNVAAAIDETVLAGTGPQDYSFAGRCDFIALEEVMQMLGAGKHCGCLSLEKHDNRIDIYIEAGRIRYLDPHHVVRRVLPGSTPMQYREIPAQVMEIAERRHAKEGVPVFITLGESNIFNGLDARAIVRQLGTEVLFDFIRTQDRSRFLYRRLDQMPDFAREHDLRLGITPVLLELSKRLDDWRSMCRAFPSPDEPVEPMPDMLARISGLSLGVLEIKVLTMINGENSPRGLTELSGLPLYDVYRLLVRFAGEGAIVAPGGLASLLEVDVSDEESVESALEALDANDDHLAVSSALDKVLGGFLDDDGDGTGLGNPLSLDIGSRHDTASSA
ncbi:MAG: DUF4388 domain-containing protein [Planctomycetes bacterium]|nr:DUF4388 domain-containing protein [Planctomycetota bacterium]